MGAILARRALIAYRLGRAAESEGYEQMALPMTRDDSALIELAGYRSLDAGDFSAAQERLARAIEMALGVEQAAPYLITQLGISQFRLGAYGDAKQSFEVAAARCKALLGDSDLSYAEALDRLAATNARLTQLAVAEPEYRQAVATAPAGAEQTLERADELQKLADQYFESGDFERSWPLYELAVSIRREKSKEGDPEIARSMLKLATVYQELGVTERVKPLLDEAHAAFTMASRYAASKVDAGFVAIPIDMARLQMRRGEYEEAVTSYAFAIAKVREAEMWNESIALYLEQGQAFEQMGNWSDASGAYMSIVALAGAGTEPEIAAKAYVAYGSLKERQGRFAEARLLQAGARDRAEAFGIQRAGIVGAGTIAPGRRAADLSLQLPELRRPIRGRRGGDL